MSIDKVREYLKEFGYQDKIIVFDDTSATVSDAAKRLNCEEGMIAKSLSFLVNDEPIVIVTNGHARIDNSKFKETFKVKAKMIDKSDVLSLVGHPVGGVCPFAVNENVVVYLDESLKEYEYVYPACGSDNSAIKLTIDELEKLSKYNSWVSVTK